MVFKLVPVGASSVCVPKSSCLIYHLWVIHLSESFCFASVFLAMSSECPDCGNWRALWHPLV